MNVTRWVIVNTTEQDEEGFPLVWHNGDTDDFTGWGFLSNASTWTAPDPTINLPIEGAWVPQNWVAYRIHELAKRED
jgi:hypothetical protein